MLLKVAYDVLGEKVVAVTNKKLMNNPVSPIFHGRDIFTPAAAYLSKGVNIDDFGPELDKKRLMKHFYEYKEKLEKCAK